MVLLGIFAFCLTILTVLGLISGWIFLLPRNHRPRGKRPETTCRFASAGMGGRHIWFTVSLNRCLNVGTSESGLFLALFFPFGLVSRPLLVPWDRVRFAGRSRFLWGRYDRYALGDGAWPQIHLSTDSAAGLLVARSYARYCASPGPARALLARRWPLQYEIAGAAAAALLSASVAFAVVENVLAIQTGIVQHDRATYTQSTTAAVVGTDADFHNAPIYRYAVGGVPYAGHAWRTYDARSGRPFAVGDRLRISYNPANPADSTARALPTIDDIEIINRQLRRAPVVAAAAVFSSALWSIFAGRRREARARYFGANSLSG